MEASDLQTQKLDELRSTLNRCQQFGDFVHAVVAEMLKLAEELDGVPGLRDTAQSSNQDVWPRISSEARQLGLNAARKKRRRL